MQKETLEGIRREKWVELYRENNPAADRWAAGYGRIRHKPETQANVFRMADMLKARKEKGDGVPIFEMLHAADRLTSCAMWIAVHEVYSRKVYMDGRDLAQHDFKVSPEGHTGSVLNMIPAYAGYMTVNALTGITRSWIMGQGHAVSAIDTVNLLVGNMTPAHAGRYSVTDEGLTRYVQDFYSYRLGTDGRQESPLGSHVNVHTAGGMAEGGYLGVIDLQYVHMPLPGERLVAFLSDGAFEEQRGNDWDPRWWRAKDSGLVIPIMINNGRRIDQRTTLSQQGDVTWFAQHMKHHYYDPLIFDGRDPAAFAWAIFEIEFRLEAICAAIDRGRNGYPARLPYGIAVAPKGAGFYNEGTNLAHNLPLGTSPHADPEAAQLFNTHARQLWVPPGEIMAAISKYQHHDQSGRVRERDNSIASRKVKLEDVPPLVSKAVPVDRRDMSTWPRYSAMYAVDEMFLAMAKANPHLRPRIGNPDEMRSNRMLNTLDALEFRVTAPEPGMPESIHGAVITALNEEVVACAALANKGGLNIIVTYEAFGTKMYGAVRQEIVFANHCKLAGCPREWISVPLVLTSHTWENSKNEQSHQDPSMSEAMMGEPSDVSRVLFVPDYNTASVVIQRLYQTHGQVWSLVVSKYNVPNLFTIEEATKLLDEGAIPVDWAGYERERQRLILTALGSYQLEQALMASARLAEREIPHTVVYMMEPGRFRKPRTDGERRQMAPAGVRAGLYPDSVPGRLFVTHTRPEPLLGHILPLYTDRTSALGFLNFGGTLTVPGLLFINRCTWAHVLDEAAQILDITRERLLEPEEIEAIEGRRGPEGLIIGAPEAPGGELVPAFR
ncbi:MAG: xylulose 5-phosphate 3-epimerase [Dehalococcoidia bacterium]|nr:xylulose 5-phosphate 3-epimerase [Dehalococcoidia bacterium]